jgi:hypothetical protein
VGNGLIADEGMPVWVKTQKGSLVNLAGYHKVEKRRFTDWQLSQDRWNVVAERTVHSQLEDLTEAEILATVPSDTVADAVVGRIGVAIADNADFLDLTNIP